MIKSKQLKILIVLISIITLGLSSCGVYLYIDKSKQVTKVNTQSVQLNLTKAQKLEDFEYLYNVIKENYPYIKLKERAYGYNWLDKKKDFEKAIKETKTNEEFYNEMSKMVTLLQNSHTAILSPLEYKTFCSILEPYMNEKNSSVEALMKPLVDENTVKAYEQWTKIIKEEYYCLPIHFVYIEGKYVAVHDEKFNKLVKVDIQEGTVLEKVNDIPINDYVKELLDERVLKHDEYKKVNKVNDLFITTNGEEKVKLKLIETNGKRTERVISSIKYKEEFEDILENKDNNLSTNIIEKESIAYIRINSLLGNFEESDDIKIYDFLQKIKNYPYLIIDIRGNGGGSESYYFKLIGHLTDKELKVKRQLAFRGGEVVEDYLRNLGANLNYYTNISNLNNNHNYPSELRTDFKFYDESDIVISPKKTVGFKGKIYLLVDDRVFSSSEGFAVFVKASKWATLIGTTTGGDGVGIAPVFVNLPNSKLVLRFPITMGLNPDGTANEETKTPPDIYSEQSYEDYLNFLQWRKKNEQKILKQYYIINPYDTVLNKTINIIKENK